MPMIRHTPDASPLRWLRYAVMRASHAGVSLVTIIGHAATLLLIALR